MPRRAAWVSGHDRLAALLRGVLHPRPGLAVRTFTTPQTQTMGALPPIWTPSWTLSPAPARQPKRAGASDVDKLLKATVHGEQWARSKEVRRGGSEGRALGRANVVEPAFGGSGRKRTVHMRACVSRQGTTTVEPRLHAPEQRGILWTLERLDLATFIAFAEEVSFQTYPPSARRRGGCFLCGRNHFRTCVDT